MYEIPKFTLEDALKIQDEDLKWWKTRLNDQCYSDLEFAALNSNIGKTNPYEIARGQSLDTFVANWKPGKRIMESYY